ncbi:putative transcription factor interactor and regulator FHA-SMAD family [Rosa chinensis]|uniref:Putative transcription factor interactor and regulator FHA-SMAD family n=1 Tax=Rosa chinensis TaxID=74649 RepID=A0A2P6QQE2_ROSCH|nr:putative transcription factor interactor and regulator FHA-SMAD family [Rosa chinensis]
MEPLSLKLEMLKGPREGETLEYRPGSKVRIGRVVRGNNLPIKDSGISTNHLIIDSDESGQWMIRDLDSSNGTIVNGTKLKPDMPLELSDGDEIKIGEYTSISVKIEGHEGDRLRRNPRRGAAGKVGTVEESRGRRGRKKEENSELEKEGEEIEVVEKPKRGRGRPGKARVLKSVDLVEEVAVPEVSLRATQRCKDVEAVVPDSENCSVECEQVKIEPKRRGGGRKRKNVQEVPRVCEEGNVAAEKNLGEIGPVGVNGDNDDKGDVPEQKDSGGIGPVDIKENGVYDDDAKGLNLGDEEAAVGFDVAESGNDNEKAKGSDLGHEEAAIDCNVGESGDKVGSGSWNCFGVNGAKDVDKKGTDSGVKEGLSWQEPDLEKMTLDDWFDYVEDSLPKAVNNEIDKICSGMREKAKLVQEYIAQYKKEKCQS